MRPIVFVATVISCTACQPDQALNEEVLDEAPPDAGTELGPCAAHTLCLTVTEVVPGEPIASGELVVIWRQLLDVSGLDEVPKIAYKTAFVPGLERYDIPLSELTPPGDNQLMCQWEDDGCHRNSHPEAVGFGIVLVVTDDDENDALDQWELSPYSANGAAFAYVAWSEHERPAGSEDLVYSWDGSPTYLGRIFPDGISAGINAYEIIGPDENFESMLTLLPPGEEAELVMCPSTQQCQVTIPRLAGTSWP